PGGSSALLQPLRPALFPYTTLFRSHRIPADRRPGGAGGRGRRPRPAAAVHLPVRGRGVGGAGAVGVLRDRPRPAPVALGVLRRLDRKSTRLNSSHVKISYAVFCLKK